MDRQESVDRRKTRAVLASGIPSFVRRISMPTSWSIHRVFVRAGRPEERVCFDFRVLRMFRFLSCVLIFFWQSGLWVDGSNDDPFHAGVLGMFGGMGFPVFLAESFGCRLGEIFFDDLVGSSVQVDSFEVHATKNPLVCAGWEAYTSATHLRDWGRFCTNRKNRFAAIKTTDGPEMYEWPEKQQGKRTVGYFCAVVLEAQKSAVGRAGGRTRPHKRFLVASRHRTPL